PVRDDRSRLGPGAEPAGAVEPRQRTRLGEQLRARQGLPGHSPRTDPSADRWGGGPVASPGGAAGLLRHRPCGHGPRSLPDAARAAGRLQPSALARPRSGRARPVLGVDPGRRPGPVPPREPGPRAAMLAVWAGP